MTANNHIKLLERLRFLCTDLIPDDTAEEVRASIEIDDIISCLIDTFPVAAVAEVPDVGRLLSELKAIRDLAVHAGGPVYVLPNDERTTLTWAMDVISTLAAAKAQEGKP